MEFRKVAVGFDAEAGIYFLAGTDFQHLTFEAKSLDALRQKLEALELRPVLSTIYAAGAPEFRKPRVGRSEVSKFKRLINDIPSRHRRGRNIFLSQFCHAEVDAGALRAPPLRNFSD